jgi:hypothetical protein
VSYIFDNFHVTDDEYDELVKSYGKLCYTANWELQRKNSNNNYTDDLNDISQELQIKLLTAGAYHKRQTYIENCLNLAKEHANDKFMKIILNQLVELWDNRKRHGANKQKFGEYQEVILDRIVSKVVPKKERPNKRADLQFNSKFNVYCKSIIWNGQKTMGKKITKEKAIRGGLVSLSDYDYLAGDV